MRHAGLPARLALLLLAAPAHAQLSASHVLLAQAGERLYTEPRDRTSVYSRMDLGYRATGWSAGVRLEGERTSDDSPAGGRSAGYEALTQRWAEWEAPSLRLRAGHFTTVLGHGLVHRSFELPGVVLDEPGTRTRYSPSRDLDGVLAEGVAGPLEWRALHGRPTDGTLSPASEQQGAPRRAGVLEGGQAVLRLPRGARAGAAFARYAFGDAPDVHLGSWWCATDLAASGGWCAVSLPFRAEYAQRGAAAGEALRLRRGDETPHALHASLAALLGRHALVAEFKDYRGFRLGTNDPPALVREHSWALLSRDTHLLDAEGEEGFLLEASGPIAGGFDAVLHLARADGPPGLRRLRFEERFAELAWRPGSGGGDVRAMLARGFDTWDFTSDRSTAGLAARLLPHAGWEVEAALERQRSVLTGFLGDVQSHTELQLAVALTRSSLGTLGLTLTRSTDPADLPADGSGVPTAAAAWFAGATLAGDIGEQHRVELFAGRRRGGRACLSGTCYEVTSWEGAELRWTSRFEGLTP